MKPALATSNRHVLVIASGLILILCWAGLVLVYYRTAQQSIWNEVQEHLISISSAVALSLDAAVHQAIWEERQSETPRYEAMMGQLRRLARELLPEGRQ